MQVEDQTEKKAYAIHYAMSSAATKAFSLYNDYRYALLDYRKDLDNSSKSLHCAEIAVDLENHCKENPGICSEIERTKEKMWQLIQKTKKSPCPEDQAHRKEIEEIKRKIAVAEKEAAKTPAASNFFIVVGILCAIAALACFIINKIVEPIVIVGLLGAWSVAGAIGSFILSSVASNPMQKAKERADALKNTLAQLEREAGRCDDDRMRKALYYHEGYHALLRVLGGARVLDLDI